MDNYKQNPELIIEEIIASTWRFYNDDGLLGNIKFNKGGVISEYSHNNERYWSFDGMFLTVMNGSKQTTVK